MAIKVACLDVLRTLEDFKVTLDRIAMERQWKAGQKKSWED
jgi:hypothetical protein